MFIKRPENPAVWESFGRAMVNFRSVKSWLLLMVIGAGLFAFGGYCHRERLIQDAVFDLVELAKQPVTITRRVQAQPDSLTIDIAHKDYEKLSFLRKLAKDDGYLTTGEDPYVTAHIRHNDQNVKVKMRLKGDMLDHLKGDKWSFRIKVKSDDTLYGMKNFSIHRPESRNFISEWLFHNAADREDLIGMRYDFVTVKLNGKDLGVYAVEEHFEKRLIENNARREGPILKFNESRWWQEKQELVRNEVKYDQWLFDKERIESGYGSYYALPIEVFGQNDIISDPVKLKQFETAANLLEGFRIGELTASQVFDIDGFATYIALTDLFGCHHSLHTNQYRFYYNPVTSKLEPIPFDIGAGGNMKLERPACAVVETDYDRRTGHGKAYFLNSLFADPDFMRAYTRAMNRISEKSYLDRLLSELGEEMQQMIAVIRTEYLNYQFSPDMLYANQRYMKHLLAPKEAMLAYVQKADDKRLVMDLASVQMFPVEVLALESDGKVIAQPAQPIYLPARVTQQKLNFTEVTFDMPEDWNWNASEFHRYAIRYRITGLDEYQLSNIHPWSPRSKSFAEMDLLRRKPNLEQFDFVAVNEKTRTINVAPGQWQIDQPMIVPAGYHFTCGPNTTFDLTNGATIISYSPLMFTGHEDAPIQVISSDSKGQGLVVLEARNRSVLHHVRFDNLSNPASGGWTLTGAVTFYESPVTITQCQFVNNRCEDGLNTVRSEFAISKSLFAKTFADAFDADFCTGTIADSRFTHTGNDAVDVSGSVVKLDNIFVIQAGDKAVSAGENSEMIAANITVNGAVIGVASKDMSRVKLENVKVYDAEYALAAYRKKPEFGGGQIEGEQVTLVNTSEQYLVDVESKVVLDGSTVKADHEMAQRVLLAMIGQ